MTNVEAEAVPIFGRSSDDFLCFLRSDEASVIISPHRFMLALGLDAHTLAREAHVQQGTVLHRPATEALQRYMRNVARVIQASTDISASVEKAIIWFKNSQISCFGGKTPQRLVCEGRVDDVIHYLQSLDAGWVG